MASPDSYCVKLLQGSSLSVVDINQITDIAISSFPGSSELLAKHLVLLMAKELKNEFLILRSSEEIVAFMILIHKEIFYEGTKLDGLNLSYFAVDHKFKGTGLSRILAEHIQQNSLKIYDLVFGLPRKVFSGYWTRFGFLEGESDKSPLMIASNFKEITSEKKCIWRSVQIEDLNGLGVIRERSFRSRKLWFYRNEVYWQYLYRRCTIQGMKMFVAEDHGKQKIAYAIMNLHTRTIMEFSSLDLETFELSIKELSKFLNIKQDLRVPLRSILVPDIMSFDVNSFNNFFDINLIFEPTWSFMIAGNRQTIAKEIFKRESNLNLNLNGAVSQPNISIGQFSDFSIFDL